MRSQEHVLTDIPALLVPNFGNRCTLVCAATLLRYWGATTDGRTLADAIGRQTGFHPAYGPPSLAYLALPGRRPQLDIAIERVGQIAGTRVQSRTRLLPRPGSIVRAIDGVRPVILNVLRAPTGVWSHSIIAFGYRYSTHRGIEVVVADPNVPDHPGTWVGLYDPWRVNAITATFVH